MSATPDRTPILTIRCPKCGRENAIGRPLCQFCKQRIAEPFKGPPIPPPEPPPPPEKTVEAENQRLKTVEAENERLKTVEAENERLKQQLASIHEALNRAIAANSRPEPSPGVVAELLKSAEERAAKLESLLAAWKTKWELAVQEAESFKKQVLAKSEAIEATFPQNSETKPRPNHRLTLIAGALVIAGILGGYGAGRYFPPNGRVKQLTNAQGQIGKLKSSLDSATKKADQIEADSKQQLDLANQQLDLANQNIGELTNTLTARGVQQRLIERRLASTQGDLASTQTQLKAALTKQQQSTEALMTQMKAQQTASDQHVHQLETDLKAAKELAALHKPTANPPTPPSARASSLIWSGAVAGRRRIDTLCTLTTQDPNVQLKTLSARKDHANGISFEVSGAGNAQVRINCASQ
jgi:hypothetical protein